MKTGYTYSILRYVHDVSSGEFANVGVVLLAPKARFAKAICRETYGRLSHMFPDMDRESFKPLMHYVSSRINALGKRLADELELEKSPKDAGDLARSVLPHDDSSLQWSEVGGGICENPEQKLNELYDRYVIRYDDRHETKTRSDGEVWSRFKKALDEKKVTSYLAPKKIVGKNDEVEFEHSYKNEQWHCIEPISFDLAKAENIKHKAHRWFGQITDASTSTEPFNVYFLVGAPQSQELSKSYEQAIGILNNVPVNHKIIQENDADRFADEIGSIIADHENGSS